MNVCELRVGLTATKDQRLPHSYGIEIHDSLFKLIRSKHLTFFDDIATQYQNSFSVSRVRVEEPNEKDPYSLARGEEAYFKIYSGDCKLIETFEGNMDSGDALNFFGLEFNISTLDYQEISLENRSLLPNPIPLAFVTPTVLLDGKETCSFPNVRPFINSLIANWNHWFPQDLYDEHETEELIANTKIVQAQGTVQGAPFWNDTFVHGWRGSVKYAIEDYDERHSLLFRLGSFSGVGLGTTAGFGRYRFYWKIKH